jgi:NADH dehydrogenase
LNARVERINPVHQVIETDGLVIAYDYLVLATGSQVKFLGVPGARDYAFSLKTLADAVTIRNHLFRRLEQAAQESDPLKRQHLLTVVVVGGGATGVEVAGTLVELKRSLQKDYPRLDLREMQIVLVQAGDTLLPDLPRRLGGYAAWKLRRMGVRVRLQTRVTRISPEDIEFQDGTLLNVGTVVWAVGLEAKIPSMDADVDQAHKNKVKVRSTLQLRGYYNVYAIGDLAYLEIQGKPLVGVAPEALQQGVAIARNIKRQIRGKAPKPFRYFNKGRLAIIGCYSGVGKVGPFFLTGFLAWFMWLTVHLVYLPGFRNRLMVMLSWLYSYGMGRRPVRLIFPNASDKNLECSQVTREAAGRMNQRRD